MKTSAMLLGTAVLLLGLVGPVPAQFKDPAELLPANTLAYLELREPAQVSKEVASLIKGSALEDMPATMARYRERMGNNNQPWRLSEIGMWGIFFSPEMIAEASRLQGGAVAITGFTKEREPIAVGIVLAGDSHAPTFFLRTYLTMDEVHKVADVEGVALYRGRRRDFGAVKQIPGQPPPPPVIREYGPAYALLPGMVVIGSTTESVKDVVLRAKGKSKESSLAEHRDFTQGVKLRERPGLFGYADLAALGTQLDEVLKGEPRGPTWGNVVKELVNPKAFRTAVASLTLRNGGVDLQAQVSINPKESSALLGFLPDTKANLELLHYAPKDSLFAGTRSISEGEKMWERAMKLADAFAKQSGAPGAPPSEQVGEIEKALDVRFGKDVLGKMRGVAVVINMRGGMPKNGPWMPMVVIEAVDADAVTSLEALLPKLAGLASGGEAPKPSSEQIQGQRIQSLPGERTPWRTALHYGHRGKVLVLGQDRKLVAEALAGGAKKEGLLGEEKVAAAIKDLDEPVAVGVGSLGQMLLGTLVYGIGSGRPAELKFIEVKPGGDAPPPIEKEKAPVKDPAPVKRAPAPAKGAALRAEAREFVLEAQDDERAPGAGPAAGAEDKAVQDLMKVIEPLPPIVISLTRKPDTLVLEVRQTGLKTMSAKLINVLLDLGVQRVLQDSGGRFKAVPAPPPAAPKAAPAQIID
jgi:hypothetical protein